MGTFFVPLLGESHFKTNFKGVLAKAWRLRATAKSLV